MPDGSLNQVTGSAGNDVYRGDRLPPDLVGDYIYGEPVGRIVRRVKPVVTEGLTQLRNAYLWNEFIRSTDPLFRPVDMATAPDGTLYIADMYRGIIQQATWSGPGTYLRARIDQYALDKVFAHGRIWRLSYEGMERDRTQPRMLNETPAQLVAHLEPSERLVARHRAAVARAEAGQVGRAGAPADAEDSTPSKVQAKVASSLDSTRCGRSKASARSTPATVRAADEGSESADADSGDPRQRDALQGGGSHASTPTTAPLATDTDTERRHPGDADAELPQGAERRRHGARGAGGQPRPRRAGDRQSDPQASGDARSAAAAAAGRRPSPPAELAVMERGEGIYKEVCFACHGDDGRGTAQPGAAPGTTMAPSLASSTARAGPSRLRHQDAAARHGRTDRRR